VGAGPDREPGPDHERDRNHGAAVKIVLEKGVSLSTVETKMQGETHLHVYQYAARISFYGREQIAAFRKAINDVWAATYGQEWSEKEQ
jgi:hypothetical protein